VQAPVAWKACSSHRQQHVGRRTFCLLPAGRCSARCSAVAVSFPGVEIRDSEKFGETVFATSDFEKNDIVVREEPLLATLPSTPEGLQRRRAVVELKFNVEDKSNLGAVFAYACTMWEYAEAASVVKEMVQSLHTVELKPDNPLHSLRLTNMGIAADTLLSPDSGDAYEACKGFSREDLIKVATASDLNSWGAEDEDRLIPATFYFGSKVTHACNGNNLKYVWDNEGNEASYIALKDIKAGELLTASYMPSIDLFPTWLRREVLQQRRLFFCKCAACETGIDHSRRLPCPKCTADGYNRGERGLLPLNWLNHDVASPTQNLSMPMVELDLALAAAGDDTPWQCNTCHERFPDDMDQLLAPVDVSYPGPLNPEEALVRQYFLTNSQLLPRNPAELVNDMKTVYELDAQIAALMAESYGVLGPAHWCTFSCAHLQSMIVNIIANYWRMFAIAIMPGMSQADPEYEEYMSKLLSSNRTVAHISCYSLEWARVMAERTGRSDVLERCSSDLIDAVRALTETARSVVVHHSERAAAAKVAIEFADVLKDLAARSPADSSLPDKVWEERKLWKDLRKRSAQLPVAKGNPIIGTTWPLVPKVKDPEVAEDSTDQEKVPEVA